MSNPHPETFCSQIAPIIHVLLFLCLIFNFLKDEGFILLKLQFTKIQKVMNFPGF
jgi:hypothetical protein